MKSFVFILFISFSFIGFSQNENILDSLQYIWENTNEDDTTRLNAIILKGDYTENLDSAILVYEEGCLFASKKNLPKYEISFFESLSVCYSLKGDAKNTIRKNKQALKIAYKLGDEKSIVENLAVIGDSYLDIEDFSNAELFFKKTSKYNIQSIVLSKSLGHYYSVIKNYDEAIKHYLICLHGFEQEKTKDTIEMVSVLMKIGEISRYLNEYDKSIEYLNNCLELLEHQNNNFYLAQVKLSLYHAYIKLEKTEEAKKNIFEALSISENIEHKHIIYIIYGTLGDYYINTQKYDSAIFFYNKVMIFKPYIHSTLINLGVTYYKKKDYNTSKKYFLKASTFRKGKGKDIILRHLFLIYEKLNQPQKALDYYKQYILIKDSVDIDKQHLLVVKKEFEYESEKINQESELLKKENDILALQSKNRNTLLYLLLSVFLLVVLTGVFFYNRLRLKKKFELAQTKSTLEKDIFEMEQKLLLSQMNPHFIFNSLNAIKAFILKNKEEKATEYLTEFAKLTRSVLESSRKDKISLNDEINLLNRYLFLEKERFSNRFNYDIILDKEIEEEVNLINIPPMLLQPIIENAIIHGVSDIDYKGEISLNFELDNDNMSISVFDNGKGIKEESKSKHKSIAREIIKERIANLNKKSENFITLTFPFVEKGTMVNLQIPL